MTKSGLLIRKKRQLKSLTLSQLSDLTGFSPQHISNIERGCALPTKNMIGPMTKALKINKKRFLDKIMEDIRNKFYGNI